MKEQYGKWKVDKEFGFGVVRNIDDPETVGFLKFQRNGDRGKDDFLNEVNSLKGLDHPNVLKLLDYDLEHETPYMVTEYCECGDMQQADLDSWTVRERLHCCRQINAGFAYLWEKGITKSDHNLKNIFLKGNKTPVIGDFESARSVTKDAKGIINVLHQASYMFWQLMEGKDYNQVMFEEEKIDKEIEKLNKQIEKLKQEKADLLNP